MKGFLSVPEFAFYLKLYYNIKNLHFDKRIYIIFSIFLYPDTYVYLHIKSIYVKINFSK